MTKKIGDFYNTFNTQNDYFSSVVPVVEQSIIVQKGWHKQKLLKPRKIMCESSDQFWPKQVSRILQDCGKDLGTNPDLSVKNSLIQKFLD